MSEEVLPRRLRMQHRKEGTGRTASFRVFDFSGIRTGWTAQNVEKDADGFDNIDQFFDLGGDSTSNAVEASVTPPQKGSSSLSKPPMRTPAPPSPGPETGTDTAYQPSEYNTDMGYGDVGGGGFDAPEPDYSESFYNPANSVSTRLQRTETSTVSTTIQKRPRGRPRKNPIVEPLHDDYASLSLLTGSQTAASSKKRERIGGGSRVTYYDDEKRIGGDDSKRSYYDDVIEEDDDLSDIEVHDRNRGRLGTKRLSRAKQSGISYDIDSRRARKAAASDAYYSDEELLSDDYNGGAYRGGGRSRSAAKGLASPPRKRGRPKGAKTKKGKVTKTASSKSRYSDSSSDSEDSVFDTRGVVYIDGKRYRQGRPSLGSSAKMVIEPIDDGTGGNSRYSKRRRWQPLNFWAGERIRYHAEKGAIVAVKEGVASPELVRRNQQFGAGVGANARRSKSRARSKSKTRKDHSDSDSDDDPAYARAPSHRSTSVKRTKKNLTSMLHDDNDINQEALEEAIYIASKGSIRQKRAEIPLGLTETPSSNLQVLLEDGVTSYQIAVVRRADALTYEKLPQELPRPPNLPHVAVAAAAFDAPEFISGTVRLLPRSMKDMESTHDCTQVFVVMTAQPKALQVDIGPNVYFLSPGDHFFVPKQCNYALTNHSADTAAEIYFNVLKGSAVEEPLAPHIMQDISDPPISSLFADSTPPQFSSAASTIEKGNEVAEEHIYVEKLDGGLKLSDSTVLSESEVDSLNTAPTEEDAAI